MDDESHRSIVANVISHEAVVLKVNKAKIRNLQSHPIVSVRSADQPFNRRTATPEIKVKRLAIDDARKSEAHGFERSVRCDRARQLRRLPTVPKIRIAIDR
jgi:hypothetical protein